VCVGACSACCTSISIGDRGSRLASPALNRINPGVQQTQPSLPGVPSPRRRCGGGFRSAGRPQPGCRPPELGTRWGAFEGKQTLSGHRLLTNDLRRVDRRVRRITVLTVPFLGRRDHPSTFQASSALMRGEIKASANQFPNGAICDASSRLADGGIDRWRLGYWTSFGDPGSRGFLLVNCRFSIPTSRLHHSYMVGREDRLALTRCIAPRRMDVMMCLRFCFVLDSLLAVRPGSTSAEVKLGSTVLQCRRGRVEEAASSATSCVDSLSCWIPPASEIVRLVYHVRK
jgi:hypothetical protein